MAKAVKLKRALKLGRRVGRGRGQLQPIPGEDPIVLVRVQVIGCKDLLAKDKGGTSDPFIHITLLHTRHQTPVIKKTLSPIWPAGTATFDLPIYLSMSDRLGVLELVVWDKDMLKKDYLGEVGIPLDRWFGDQGERTLGWDEQGNVPFTVPLQSSRENTNASGTVQIKLGFVQPPNASILLENDEIYNELVRRSRPSIVSAPPTEGVGTIRSHSGVIEPFEDDGGLSSESDSDDTDGEDEDELFVDAPTPDGSVSTPTASSASTPTSGTSPLTPNLSISAASPSTPYAKPNVPKSPSFMRIKFSRRNTGNSVTSNSVTSSSATSSVGEDDVKKDEEKDAKEKKKRFRKSFPGPGIGVVTKKRQPYSFGGPNDIVGIVMLEIKSADDLPRLSNMIRTGWDMDPFVVISFGKKVFRTRVIRHSRNPIWDERLLFHVRKHETTFKIKLTVADWDKLSANDHIGDATLDVGELLADAEGADEVTGLFPLTDSQGNESGMKEFKLSISTAKEVAWESRHHPVLTVRAKYQPYASLRQKFWQQYLKQYDSDDTGRLSHIEVTSMLDSLGSTLTHTTINAFWKRHGKDPKTEELTVEECILCLEEELGRPDSEKRVVGDPGGEGEDTSVSATPVLSVANARGEELALDDLDFSGPPMSGLDGATDLSDVKLAPPQPVPTQPMRMPLDRRNPSYSSSSDGDEVEEPEEFSSSSSTGIGKTKKMGRFRRKVSGKKNSLEQGPSSSSSSSDAWNDPLERVINVKNCPLCHRPRLNAKAEMDIITHLAVCASSDWNSVGGIVVGNFVTASQAQRKWYGRIVGKISGGDYKLGANSGNIIVQNRMTGGLEEEKMQVYVRLGIRLLYKGATSRMEGGGARRLLKSLSIKQGLKYDSLESAKDIPGFIVFHGLDVGEVLDPLDSFKTFNEFFYRKMKPTARPVDEPDNPFRLVSAADCRLMVFPSVAEATRLWIKGREFTVARLLGEKYKADVGRYEGGAVAIFRLAPQDYHRFHSPVTGKIGEMSYIAGEYYTVNPQAIRTALDVYGENVRKIVPIDSPHFGRVMAVCVGAMMVGTIKTTVEEQQEIQRGQEFGYFAFGGSTIVMLFERGSVEWDEDLLINSKASLETLVRVGMGIGMGTRR